MRRAISLFTPLLLFLGVLFVSLNSFPDRKRIASILTGQVTLIKPPNIKVIYRSLNSPEDIINVRCEAVIPVTYTNAVSLAELQPEEKKRKFIDMVLPSVLIANYEVAQTRKNLSKILEKLDLGYKLSRAEREFVESVLGRCKSESIEDALLKAHPVPPSLVIAQAAIESGWGTSRFFLEGNNLFGIWAFKDKSNAIEAQENNVHLRAYSSILDAVRDYMYNVNAGWAYEKFRKYRLKGFGSVKLLKFLEFYSIERGRYVRKLRRIIKENNLTELDYCVLDPSYLR
ncbi:Bax protein [Hydrogenivirga caldilitoris]|uniref:Bax protein n=1 Tax=Hydrogenivirga caldilitoris TaxID=246264 RepID=A0A497XPD9_9AQUI|nr:glucosaminidase domain-containing protein [Hydrogenivirga caldilitoris]RLJ70748.1 Bax protein [Hydrogenivirga caldilitoris]